MLVSIMAETFLQAHLNTKVLFFSSVLIRTKSSYIPFRESKLTKLFQAVFCGKGKALMIVNINQCASTYDETLHVMKFSAVAKQVGLGTFWCERTQ